MADHNIGLHPPLRTRTRDAPVSPAAQSSATGERSVEHESPGRAGRARWRPGPPHHGRRRRRTTETKKGKPCSVSRRLPDVPDRATQRKPCRAWLSRRGGPRTRSRFGRRRRTRLKSLQVNSARLPSRDTVTRALPSAAPTPARAVVDDEVEKTQVERPGRFFARPMSTSPARRVGGEVLERAGSLFTVTGTSPFGLIQPFFVAAQRDVVADGLRRLRDESWRAEIEVVAERRVEARRFF